MTISYSLFKNKFKKSIVDSMYNEVVTKSARYYHWLGKENTWSDFLSPFIPSSSSDIPGAPADNFRYDLHVRRDMLYAKAILPSDVSYIVPRYDWVSGQVYDMYDDAYSPDTPAYSGATVLEEAKFYVLTSEYNVYKCISNNYNSPSTQAPTGTSMDVFAPGNGTDGYLWKFMYTIPVSLRNKFLNSEFMPVSTALKSQFYTNGSIIQIEIANGGTGYTASAGGAGTISASTTSTTVSGTSTTFTTSMAAGYKIKNASNQTVGIVKSVTSNTSLELTTRALNAAAGSYTIHRTTAVVSGDGYLEANPKVVNAINYSSLVTGGSFMTGATYTIVSLGTTNFTLIGASSNTVGETFVATGSGSGTGTAYGTYNTGVNPGDGYATGTYTLTFSAPTITIGDEYTMTGTATVSAVTAATSTTSSGTSGTTALTIGGTITGTFKAGQSITGTGIAAGSRIIAQVSGTTGGAGVYTVSAAFSGTVSGVQTASYTKITSTTISTAGYGYEFAPTVTIDAPYTANTFSNNATYALNDKVEWLGQYYNVSTAGQVGNSPPTHTTGVQTLGTAVLTYIGRKAILTTSVENSKVDIDLTISSGQITAVTINNGGVGFSKSAITVTSPAGSGGQLNALLDVGNVNTLQANVEQLAVKGSIEYMVVVEGGAGFDTAPTVVIKGDGIGATATAVVDNGKVKSIQMVNKGSGYTWTDIVINGNVGSGGAVVRAIMSPLNGHGYDAIDELNANSMVFYSSISKDVLNGIEVTNDYRKAGLLKNPKQYNSSNRLTADVASGCILLTGIFNSALFEQDMLLQKVETTPPNYKNYRIVEITPTQMIVSVFNNFTINVADVLVNENGDSILVTAVQEREFDQFSGELLYLTVREKYAPSSEQLVTLKTIVTL